MLIYRTKTTLVLLGIICAMYLPTMTLAESPVPDFRLKYQIRSADSAWVKMSALGLITGAEKNIVLLDSTWPHNEIWSVQLEKPITDLEVVGNHVFLSHTDGTLSRLNLLKPDMVSTVRTQKTWQGAAQLAFDGNFLLVTVGKETLRFAMPQAAYCGPPNLDVAALGETVLLHVGQEKHIQEVADMVPWAGTFLVSNSSGTVSIFSPDNENPKQPLMKYSGEDGFLALDHNYLYKGGPKGLFIAPSPGRGTWLPLYLPVFSTMAQSAGRNLFVAEGKNGLSLFYNQMEAQAIHTINQVSTSWNPNAITISEGDTVQWNFGSIHNVEETVGVNSCIAKSGGYTSGAVGTSTSYNRAFPTAGTSFFKCNPHCGFGMRGVITIEAASSPPPGVPDGETGTAMTATRPGVDDGSVTVVWDDSTCTGDGFHLIHGGGSDLPSTVGGTYVTDGGVCTLGTSSPHLWSNTPNPAADASTFIWWLILSNDTGGTEGTWGTDSAGNQRNGSGAGGSSGRCTNTAKNVSNTCGT